MASAARRMLSSERSSSASISARRSGNCRYSVARPTSARSTTRSSGAVTPCSENTASAASSNWARRISALGLLEVMRTIIGQSCPLNVRNRPIPWRGHGQKSQRFPAAARPLQVGQRQQLAAAVKAPRLAVQRIGEGQAARQQLQRAREVALGHVMHFGIEAVAPQRQSQGGHVHAQLVALAAFGLQPVARPAAVLLQDRKSTRLNSSHSQISYAV